VGAEARRSTTPGSGSTLPSPGTSRAIRSTNSSRPACDRVELITHLAFYSGWPTAMSAMRAAKEVFAAAEAGGATT
jgi:hypothetical protein